MERVEVEKKDVSFIVAILKKIRIFIVFILSVVAILFLISFASFFLQRYYPQESIFSYLSAYLGNPVVRFTKNLHVVDEGKLYRSKQLSIEELDSVVKKYNIKTVVNFRFTEEDGQIFEKEKEYMQSSGLNFIHYPLTAYDIPSKEMLEQIFQIFDTAPRPILIHCARGADRTGLFAALWVLEIQQGSLEDALQQLSSKYGHLKLYYPDMTKFIRVWHELRKTKSRKESLEMYPDIYKVIHVASIEQIFYEFNLGIERVEQLA